MNLLHTNLANLAKIAGESRHSATSGIHVVTKPGEYRVEVTDGKRAIRVEAVDAADVAKFPVIPALQNAPNTATEAILQADAFEKMMKAAPKKVAPHLRTVALVLGLTESTLATSDLEDTLIRQPRNLQGRYPNFSQILPKEDALPEAKIEVEGHLLAELLKVVADFAADGNGRVEICLYGPDKPMLLRTSNPEQKVAGLAAPIVDKKTADPKAKAKPDTAVAIYRDLLQKIAAALAKPEPVAAITKLLTSGFSGELQEETKAKGEK